MLRTVYPVHVTHLFEPASTGRAKCRGCNQPIQRGELRFGLRLPNTFGEGEMTLWFHPLCAAYKIPEQLTEALQTNDTVPDRERLEKAAQRSLAHERVRRIDGAEQAPSGQAACRHCHEPIEKGSWRLRIVFYREGMFSPGGYIHLRCAKAYFEADGLLDPVLHFSPALGEPERQALASAFDAA